MESTRVTRIDIAVKSGEWVYISPLSDLHIESSAFDVDAFEQMMSERAALPGHRAILLGDVLDLVVPGDLKRHTPSVQDASIAGRDDWLNRTLDLAVERLNAPGITYDYIGRGNHELEFLKRHGVDTTSMLARDLRCAAGGYSGVIEYNLRAVTAEGNPANHSQSFRILWHHGAWGGRAVKGLGGAKDFARAFEGWHIMAYGHNHQALVDREIVYRPTRRGDLEERPRYYVCTGAWVGNYSDDPAITHYAERGGMRPTGRLAPLIKVGLLNHGGGTGDEKGWKLHYTVEL